MTDHPQEFFCEVCGKPASYGFGVSIRTGRMGRWYCAEHQTDFNPKPAPPRPDVVIPDDIMAMSLAQIQNELSASGEGERKRRMALWRRLDQITALARVAVASAR